MHIEFAEASSSFFPTSRFIHNVQLSSNLVFGVLIFFARDGWQERKERKVESI